MKKILLIAVLATSGSAAFAQLDQECDGFVSSDPNYQEASPVLSPPSDQISQQADEARTALHIHYGYGYSFLIYSSDEYVIELLAYHESFMFPFNVSG